MGVILFKLFRIGILALCFAGLGAAEPEVFFLTWREDPSHTIAVRWIGEDEAEQIEYQRVGEDSWKRIAASKERMEASALYIYSVEIQGLEANTRYRIRWEKEGGRARFFQTLPEELDQPLNVVIGGDLFLDEKLFKKMNKQVAALDPAFAILGGDIAYSEGLRHALKKRDWQARRWRDFFKIWADQLVTKEGRIIPLVPVLGNHDVREGFDATSGRNILFFQLFPFPQERVAYRLFNVANVHFYLLDSGHMSPVGGAQTAWLESALQEGNPLYSFPVYHIAAYPSVYSFDHASSKDIRAYWIPLFEKMGVSACFENDNHAFKRTYPLLQGKVDPNGILYLGDGSWGVPPRKPRTAWYLEKAARTNCIWLLTLSKEQCRCKALNLSGETLDALIVSPKAVLSAQ